MFGKLGDFFNKMKKPEVKELTSKDAAKERLHLVLMQDRANVSVDFLELMKQEIIDVIKKYIVVDESAIDVRLTNQENEDGTNGAPALYANIPILNIKNDTKAEKINDGTLTYKNGELENATKTEESSQEQEMVLDNEVNTKPIGELASEPKDVANLGQEESRLETEIENNTEAQIELEPEIEENAELTPEEAIEIAQEIKENIEEITAKEEHEKEEKKEAKTVEPELDFASDNEVEEKHEAAKTEEVVEITATEEIKNDDEEDEDDDDVTFDDLLKKAEEEEKQNVEAESKPETTKKTTTAKKTTKKSVKQKKR